MKKDRNYYLTSHHHQAFLYMMLDYDLLHETSSVITFGNFFIQRYF